MGRRPLTPPPPNMLGLACFTFFRVSKLMLLKISRHTYTFLVVTTFFVCITSPAWQTGTPRFLFHCFSLLSFRPPEGLAFYSGRRWWNPYLVTFRSEVISPKAFPAFAPESTAAHGWGMCGYCVWCGKSTPLALDRGLICFIPVSVFPEDLGVQALDVKWTHSLTIPCSEFMDLLPSAENSVVYRIYEFRSG